MPVREHTERILLEISGALIAERLVNLPEVLIVVLDEPFYHARLILFLHVRQDLLS